MMEYVMIGLEKLQIYIGESWQYALFVAALVYLLLCRREKRTRPLFVWYTLAFLVLYFCPLTARIIMACVGKSVYWRMLWLVPMPLVIAYAGTRFVSGFSGKRFARPAAGILLAACIVFSGTCVYAPGTTPYVRAQNINKLPVEVVDICNQINEFRQGRYACITAAYDLMGYVRQYDADILMTYGRRGGGKRWEILTSEMLSPAPNFRRVARHTRKLNGNYLVYPSTDEQHEEILSLGYEQIGSHGSYRIYYDARKGARIERRAAKAE